MPGMIMTELMRSMSQQELKSFGLIDEHGNHIQHENFKTPAQGASTTVLACVAPQLENHGGLYLNDCHICEVGDAKEINQIALSRQPVHKVADYAVDEASADRLWEISEKSIKA